MATTRALTVGIIGDFDPGRRSHVATNEGLRHAADALSVPVELRWLDTPGLLSEEGEEALEQCDGLWASPGSPYRSKEAALRAIQFARERDWPFVGT